jgi:hypothetical protein
VLRKFGGGIRLVETPALAISAVTPTQVLLNNPDRVFWIVENLSSYSGTLAFNDRVTLGAGLLVIGLGGFVSLSVDEDGEVVTYPVWAIESVAGQTWYVTEIVKA